MPPKAKFSKEQITEAGLQIVREKGADSLTARALGEKLGSSSCPVFTVFKNMEEVQQSVINAAKTIYKEYVDRGLTEKPAFRGVGKQYILFAIKEPFLFRLLFMTEQPIVSDLAGALLLIEDNYDKILSSIINEIRRGKRYGGTALPAFMDLFPRDCHTVRYRNVPLHRRRNKHHDDRGVYRSNEKCEGRTAQ